MSKIKLIINPSSGRQAMEKKIDVICKLLLDDGFVLSKFFTKNKYDAMLEARRTCDEDFDLIIVCGGDGTVNEVVKGITTGSRRVPIAILASGTVNDFANYLELPKTAYEFYDLIKRNRLVQVDIGCVNEDFFVNVAAGGLLSNVAYQAQPEVKAVLGRIAYYLEGLRELANQGLETVKVRIESDEFTSEEDILLFVISNSSSIGGFTKLAPEADIVDGLLDVVLIKKADISELVNIFVNVLTGEHINHPKVIYYKTKRVSIECDNKLDIDIDGEYGGKLPAEFKVIPKGLSILV